ncbi:hypothetical protein P4278_26095 [Bacillus thuringiensis]|nr:hypothetical protein [Bacillus thuringiensis]MED2771009.1 hypothetical protein [Bacillus thuringiensis]MED2783147.1 hypothetical protein [Bacillus thuringiensis]
MLMVSTDIVATKTIIEVKSLNTSVEMYVLEGTIRIKQQPRACFITGQTSENQRTV